MRLVSLFSGAGGLDLGFKKAGFDIVWANEYDKSIWETFDRNFSQVFLDKRDLTTIPSSDIPDVDGIIGGPPCQSWSEAGAQRGLNDLRGQLFFEYIRILKDKQPKFFLAENVSGILHPRHSISWRRILDSFASCGYRINFQLINANDYDVPQDRLRVIIVGYHQSIGKKYLFPLPVFRKLVLKDVIYGLPEPIPAKSGNKANENLSIPNHEYMNGGFSSIYMSRNRVRSWNEPSFTIQAGGRHAPIHPKAPKMIFIEQNKRIFAPAFEDQYRRLSVRECARIQTFPDDFIFYYKDIADGYKMVGNAVPVMLAYHLALKIVHDID